MTEERMAVTEEHEPMLSPRQHYAAAENLLQAAVDLPRQVAAHDYFGMIQAAQVHATLATVKQGQFNAWKAQGQQAVQVAPVSFAHREHGYIGEPCPHLLTPHRCGTCNQRFPRVVCGKCGTGVWGTHRMVGSRCDLPGCGGLMVDWPGPKP